MFYFYQLPVPRLSAGDPFFDALVERAARLICTTPEFDDLAQSVGLAVNPAVIGTFRTLKPANIATFRSLNPPTSGISHPSEEAALRARLRAEIDGIVAHLYALTEAEFTHILSTFPLVSEEVKLAALEAYRDVERGLLK